MMETQSNFKLGEIYLDSCFRITKYFFSSSVQKSLGVRMEHEHVSSLM